MNRNDHQSFKQQVKQGKHPGRGGETAKQRTWSGKCLQLLIIVDLELFLAPGGGIGNVELRETAELKREPETTNLQGRHRNAKETLDRYREKERGKEREARRRPSCSVDPKRQGGDRKAPDSAESLGLFSPLQVRRAKALFFRSDCIYALGKS